MKHIFLMAGRTGGPLTPLLGISSHLPYRPFILGVRDGYEEQVARTSSAPFLSLPATKLSALSFGGGIIPLLRELPLQLLLLTWAIILSCVYVLRHQPVAVLGAGGFTSVPMVITVRLSRLLGGHTRIVIHQQDPLVGMANKIALRLADIKSYVYATSLASGLLDDATQIPNPIRLEQYQPASLKQTAGKFPELSQFLDSATKPILLVFGGGSGAKVINDWVIESYEEILAKFTLVHLTGVLQDTPLPEITRPGYWRQEFAHTEMPLLMTESDVVLCRAGLGSISELTYLQKPAFLVPLAGSHQEINSAEVADRFQILDQSQTSQWVETITTRYPTAFESTSWPSPTDYQSRLHQYYAELEAYLESNLT